MNSSTMQLYRHQALAIFDTGTSQTHANWQQGPLMNSSTMQLYRHQALAIFDTGTSQTHSNRTLLNLLTQTLKCYTRHLARALHRHQPSNLDSVIILQQAEGHSLFQKGLSLCDGRILELGLKLPTVRRAVESLNLINQRLKLQITCLYV